MKKREIAAFGFQKLESNLQCPICSADLNVVDSNRLVCENRHSYDFAKQGYVNMLQKQVSSMYDQDLFDARYNIISVHNLYKIIHQKIADIINALPNENRLIFDAGSGEGSHLRSIIKLVDKDNTHGIGLDISKDGVLLASKNYSHENWVVGDLSRTPFKESSIDVILSYLSPANYEEFQRILKPNGILIKVIPGSKYLKEIRETLAGDSQEYENTDTLELMRNKVDVISEERITYEVELASVALKDLIKMTPLGWHVSQQEVRDFTETSSKIITVDLHIIQAGF